MHPSLLSREYGSAGKYRFHLIVLEHLGDGDFGALVLLRAERDGEDKAGRVYSIHMEALDGEGNTGQVSTTVVVPHDGRSR